MEIIKNSIKDIHALLEALANNMSGPNYCIDFDIRVFQYSQGPNFTLSIFRELYEDISIFDTEKGSAFIDNIEKSIEGPVNEIEFELAKQGIKKSLRSTYDESPGAYRDMLGAYTGWSLAQELAKKHSETFWGIINSNFTMPPTHSFQHKPDHDSFFGGWVMWEFCYVLLNDNTKEGIVIAGQAYD